MLLQQPYQMRHAGIIFQRSRWQRLILLAPLSDQSENHAGLD
jgi:hypothetical protein